MSYLERHVMSVGRVGQIDCMRIKWHGRHGLTLMEILCVIAIIAVLAAMYFGAISRTFVHVEKLFGN